jgi:hypothetical protein
MLCRYRRRAGAEAHERIAGRRAESVHRAVLQLLGYVASISSVFISRWDRD